VQFNKSSTYFFFQKRTGTHTLTYCQEMWKLDVKIIYTLLFHIVLKDLIWRPSAKCNVETEKGTHNTNSYPSVYNRTLPWKICKVHMWTSWNLLSKKGTFSMAALVCWRIFMDFLTPQQILTPKGLHKSWQNKSPKDSQGTSADHYGHPRWDMDSSPCPASKVREE